MLYRMLGTRQLMVAIDFHIGKKCYGSQWLSSILWLSIAIIFCVQQEKDTRTGLEQLRGE